MYRQLVRKYTFIILQSLYCDRIIFLAVALKEERVVRDLSDSGNEFQMSGP